MSEQQLTNEQIDLLIKKLKDSDLHSDSEKWRLTSYYEECRPITENKELATKEEAQELLGRILPPGSIKQEPKAPSETTSRLLKDTTPWAQ